MNSSGPQNYIRQKPMFDPSVHLFPFEQHRNRGARPSVGTEHEHASGIIERGCRFRDLVGEEMD
ncbi:hypothetical protein RHMOL_Rhmol05G0222900 [Rhododendron molle]|uniref:Uncharacterized protein n=1 Tax=Rhododendron molle TaxID=49168 RepID=A0ACC0NRY0_RHOML|nr:hypothetical protein RHMOL_Rhmol05G0222900 [Rhododendron molle]